MMTFEKFSSHTKALAEKIKNSGFKPEMIIAIARAGWIPARLLSSYLGIKSLASIGLTYSNPERTKLEAYSLPSPLPKAGVSVLLVEDCLETGKSMAFAKKLLLNHEIKVRTASVFALPAAIQPDYVLQIIDKVPEFPWE